MAATMTADAGLADVAQAAAHPFTRRGETVLVLPVADLLAAGAVDVEPGLRAVVVPDRRRVECIAEDPGRPGVAAALASLAAADWQVVGLVPAGRLGAAHRAWRGVAVTLQGWWRDPVAGVCFGAEERP